MAPFRPKGAAAVGIWFQYITKAAFAGSYDEGFEKSSPENKMLSRTHPAAAGLAAAQLLHRRFYKDSASAIYFRKSMLPHPISGRMAKVQNQKFCVRTKML